MGVLGTMVVNFTANVSGLQSGVNTAKTSIADLAGPAGVVAGSIAAIGIAGVAAGAKAVQMAGDFQSGMTTLVTGAGESQKNIAAVSSGILNLATSTGTSTKQLTDGMYMIESAGYHGAAGLDVLKNAAQGAKVGNADLGTVANAVTTEMTDFASSGLTASQATNTLIATVSNGKTTMQALGGALANILPTASAAGVSLTGTSAAMATMTGEGIPAAQAATYLRQTIMAIENPSSKAASAMKSMGLSSSDVAAEMKKSLPDALAMITDAAAKKFPVGSQGYIAAVSNMVGGTKSMQGILDLTGDHLNTFKGNVTNIAGAVKNGGNSIVGWSQVQDTFNLKMDKAKEVLETTGIKIGTMLLPVVGKLVDAFSSPQFQSFATMVGTTLVNGIQGLITGISTLVSWGTNTVKFFQNNQVAMDALKAVVIGLGAGLLAFAIYSIPAAVAGFGAMAVAAWAAAAPVLALAAPFIAIGAIVAIVAFGIILAIQHWGDIVKWLQGIWGAFSSWFMGVLGAIGNFFHGVWDGIQTGIQAAWNFIVNVVKVGAALLLTIVLGPIFAIGDAFVWLYNHNYYFKDLVDAIVNFFKGCFSWLQGAWTATINWLVGAWNNVVGFAKNLWNQVSTAIRIGFFAAIAFVQSIWNSIASFFTNAWNTYIAGPLHTLWQNVSSVFSSAWSTYIAGPIGSLWNTLSSTVSGWATNAFDWGKNLIQGFINGIKNMAGAVGQTLGDVAHNIASFLGFHSPTEKGPGSTADQWAPNFVNMYTSGLEAGIPKIQAAMSKLAAPMEISLKSGSYPNGNSNSSAAVLAALAAGNNSNGNNNNQPIALYIDGKEVTSRLGPHIANAIRVQQGRRGK